MNAEMALKELLYYYSIQRLREKSAFLYFKKIMTVGKLHPPHFTTGYPTKYSSVSR